MHDATGLDLRLPVPVTPISPSDFTLSHCSILLLSAGCALEHEIIYIQIILHASAIPSATLIADLISCVVVHLSCRRYSGL